MYKVPWSWTNQRRWDGSIGSGKGWVEKMRFQVSTKCCYLVICCCWRDGVCCITVVQQPGSGDPGSLGSVCLPDGTCLLPTLLCARGQLCVCAPAYYNRSGQCGTSQLNSCSQVKITLKVKMEYRLFLAIDMSLYRHNKKNFGGCAKFHSLLF